MIRFFSYFFRDSFTKGIIHLENSLIFKGGFSMGIVKGNVEEILGLSVRARHKESLEVRPNQFSNPIIHRQIRGDKVYQPLNKSLWSQIDQKEGNEMPTGKNEKRNQMDMNGGPIADNLNSDNAFNDSGLANERKLREAGKNKTSK